MTEAKSNTAGGGAAYCEVRHTDDSLEAIGIHRGDGVALVVGPDVDYETGDVVLWRYRDRQSVGGLAVFRGVTGDGACVILSPAGDRSYDLNPVPAHKVELRGRAVRSSAERARLIPRGLSRRELRAIFFRALDLEPPDDLRGNYGND